MSQPTQQVNELSIRSCLNATGSTIPKGIGVKLKASPTEKGEIEKLASGNDYIYGVTMVDIPTGERGPVQVDGKAICVAGGSVTAGGPVSTDANGKFVNTPAPGIVMGLAYEGASADDEFNVELCGPGGARALAGP